MGDNKISEIKFICSVWSDVYSHTLQIILSSDIFVFTHILFYVSTMDFNQKMHVFITA